MDLFELSYDEIIKHFAKLPPNERPGKYWWERKMRFDMGEMGPLEALLVFVERL